MNSNFKFEDGELPGVKIITPFYLEDNRGYFLKSLEKDIFKEAGIKIDIYEDFESYSVRNVIRGLHFQTQNPQVKIVRAIKGSIKDILVDLRRDSDTFGQSMSIELSEDNRLSVLVPAGFAHGFLVLSEDAIVSYKCIGKYLANCDTGIIWNDDNLKIDWGIDQPIISKRDSGHMTFNEFKNKYGGL